MSVFDDIMQGLNEALEYEKEGKLKGVRRCIVKISPIPHYKGSEVKNIRISKSLSQSALASVLGVSKKTVEAWESGKNTPEGPAQRMLDIIKNESKFLDRYIETTACSSKNVKEKKSNRLCHQ